MPVRKKKAKPLSSDPKICNFYELFDFDKWMSGDCVEYITLTHRNDSKRLNSERILLYFMLEI